MGYKTILTVLTDARQALHPGGQLDAALALAAAEDAHLDVLCLGVDDSNAGYYYAGASGYIIQQAIDGAMEAAEAIRAAAASRMQTQPLRWSLDAAVAQMGGVSAVVGARARYADLTLSAPAVGPQAAPHALAALEAAMFEGGCPVLVMPLGGRTHGGAPSGGAQAAGPHAGGGPGEPAAAGPDGAGAPPAGTAPDIARRVLIAWNHSTEALCAVRRALPFITRAEAVEIAVIDPSPTGPEGPDPGAALCRMLTRHGARAEIAVLVRTLPRISDLLTRRALEIDASLIVMGAYGHSRFREAILGGSTRNMLELSEVPVLMAR